MFFLMRGHAHSFPSTLFPSKQIRTPLKNFMLSIVCSRMDYKVKLFKADSATRSGLNLGKSGAYNGSVAFNGYYDANRIASKAWTLIPESLSRTDQFLETGELNVTVQYMVPGGKRSLSEAVVTLSANADDLNLPIELSCADDNTFTFTGADGKPLEITIPSNLTRNTDPNAANQWPRCRSNDTDPQDNGGYYLGRPFFQVAYAYVNTSGALFLAAANDYDLEVSPVFFQANKALKPVKPNSSAPSVLPSGTGWSVVLLGLVCWIGL